jgi:hypothetical protein
VHFGHAYAVASPQWPQMPGRSAVWRGVLRVITRRPSARLTLSAQREDDVLGEDAHGKPPSKGVLIVDPTR